MYDRIDKNTSIYVEVKYILYYTLSHFRKNNPVYFTKKVKTSDLLKKILATLTAGHRPFFKNEMVWSAILHWPERYSSIVYKSLYKKGTSIKFHS